MSSFYKNAGGIVCPTTKRELIKEISIRLNRGQTNLNDIDTSKITDMSLLFSELSITNVGYIDISLWNVSNVETMNNMFTFCPNINFFYKLFFSSRTNYSASILVETTHIYPILQHKYK